MGYGLQRIPRILMVCCQEIIVISPKKHRAKTLSIIPEDPEASKKFEVRTTISHLVHGI